MLWELPCFSELCLGALLTFWRKILAGVGLQGFGAVFDIADQPAWLKCVILRFALVANSFLDEAVGKQASDVMCSPAAGPIEGQVIENARPSTPAPAPTLEPVQAHAPAPAVAPASPQEHKPRAKRKKKPQKLPRSPWRGPEEGAAAEAGGLGLPPGEERNKKPPKRRPPHPATLEGAAAEAGGASLTPGMTPGQGVPEPSVAPGPSAEELVGAEGAASTQSRTRSRGRVVAGVTVQDKEQTGSFWKFLLNRDECIFPNCYVATYVSVCHRLSIAWVTEPLMLFGVCLGCHLGRLGSNFAT